MVVQEVPQHSTAGFQDLRKSRSSAVTFMRIREIHVLFENGRTDNRDDMCPIVSRSTSSDSVQVCSKLCQTANPSHLMPMARALVGNAFVHDCDFALARLDRSKRDGYQFLRGIGCDLPGIDELSGMIDHPEDPADPHQFPIGKLIPNSVAATNAQIHFGFCARDQIGAPPLRELLRLGPGGEQTFR